MCTPWSGWGEGSQTSSGIAERDFVFGVCPSGFLVALRFCFSLMHLLSPLLSFLTHPSLEQPPAPALHSWRLGCGCSPVHRPCVCFWDQCRGVDLWVGALQDRRAAGGFSGPVHLHQGPPAPLHRPSCWWVLCPSSQVPVVLQPRGGSGHFREQRALSR